MSDQPQTDTPANTPHKAASLDWDKAGPHIQTVLVAIVAALERFNNNTGSITGRLLCLITLCFTGLAAYALNLNHVDTAEKLMIGLISFLGGAAMFSGSPKK